MCSPTAAPRARSSRARRSPRRFLPAALESPELRFIISMEPLDLAQEPPVRVFGWGQLLSAGRQAAGERVRGSASSACSAAIPAASSTPPAPAACRGASILTHGSILCNLMGCYHLLQRFRARRRGVPLLPAAVPFLRAHGRPVPADLARRADLLCRACRQADRQHGRGAPDADAGGAAPLRGDASAHHALGRQDDGAAPPPVRSRLGARPQAL